MRTRLRSDQGHVGPSTASLAGVAAAIVTAVGLGMESKVTEIIGVALFGLAIVLATQAPHLWLRKIYRRIDRITDESDSDRHEGFRLEIQTP